MRLRLGIDKPKKSKPLLCIKVLMEVGIPVHFNFDGDAMLLELQAAT